MARTDSTAVLAVRYVATIANQAAPTTAEINAGVNLSPFVTRDGVKTPQSGSTVDVAGIDSKYNATSSGTFGGDPITLMFFRDNVSGNDTAWTTLPRGTKGFIVIRRFGGATGASADAFVAAQRVEVWPIDVISREMADTAANEAQKFTVQCAIPTAPNDNAVVS